MTHIVPGGGTCPLAAAGGAHSLCAQSWARGFQQSSNAWGRSWEHSLLIVCFCMKVSREEAGARLGAHVQPPLLGLAGGCPGPLGHGYSSGRVMFMFLNQKTPPVSSSGDVNLRGGSRDWAPWDRTEGSPAPCPSPASLLCFSPHLHVMYSA